MSAKPLRRKAYGSIPHLPNSRLGPGDHQCSPGQARIATEKRRDARDTVIVQEKLDGACTAVARLGDEVIPLGRSGHVADTSPHEHIQLFHRWVEEQWDRFYEVLEPGQRLVGEWLAMAHGTRYDLPHGPFVAFDLMEDDRRLGHEATEAVCRRAGIPTPYLVHVGDALSVDDALAALGPHGHHGAVDPVEGAVWRVERAGKVDFLVKWVHPEKEDGAYFSELTGKPPVWNWRPPPR